MSISICFPQQYNPVKTSALGMGHNVHVCLYIPRLLRTEDTSQNQVFWQDLILSLVFQMKSLGGCREIFSGKTGIIISYFRFGLVRILPIRRKTHDNQSVFCLWRAMVILLHTSKCYSKPILDPNTFNLQKIFICQ